MKELKPLKFEELSTRQKLGMVMTGIIRIPDDYKKFGTFDENLDFVLDLVRNHSIGAIWVIQTTARRDEAIAKIKEVADYPILMYTDAESGIAPYLIGRHNALGVAGSEELAYTFGKITGISARKIGYNVVCDPVLDMADGWAACGHNMRNIGSDKNKVAKLAAAVSRGLHDAGVLSVGKHYPGGVNKSLFIDSHMAEGYSESTKEDLLEYDLFPYLELMKQDLLDGIMVSHCKYINIDPEYPASLSKKVINIIREQGFEGVAITDALNMMGIQAKYGDTLVKGMCIEAGNDLALPFNSSVKAYKDMCDAYDAGIISDERLDEAVKRILAMQEKVLKCTPKFDEITEDDVQTFNRINRDSVYATADEGLDIPISKDGKHFFAVLVKNETEIADTGKVTVDTFTNDWYSPSKIMEKLEKEFPNSTVEAISQFPTPSQNMRILTDSLGHDDVVFITFTEAPAFAGSDHITHRIVALINAMQMSNRISTLVHFGNPFVLEELSHIPRKIIGGVAPDNIQAALDVLAGNYPAKGVMTYDVKFQ